MASRRWFHQNITGHEAQQMLMTRGRDGSFLCRPSGNKKDYTLSVRRGGSVTHIKIQNKGDQFDLYGGDPFPTLSSLIHYYMENDIPEKNGEIIELRYPMVTCQEPTTERWFHGNISNADASKLMLDKGKNGSYLLRESVTSPGNYVVTVRSDDIIKHVMLRNIDGKYDFGGGTKFDTISELVENYRINPMVEKNGGTVVHLKQPLNSTKFTASSIGNRVTELKKENEINKDGFWEEFEQLQQQEHKHENSRKVGLSSENKQRNRFRNIVPYDNSRVILTDGEDQKQSYINASYISGERKREYIATQGVLTETIGDFWRMVWQENTNVILLGNREVEKGKSRCEKYWPDVESCVDYDGFTIFSNKETETQEFISREFELRNNEQPDAQSRTIYHYQYIAWPEHGLPENVSSVLGILHDINLKQKNNEYSGPIIVQCSNGIGRTATFIIIDILLKLLQRKDLDCQLDIQKTVQQVRSQRRGMVQLEAQYKFIYLALAHFVEMEHHYHISYQQQQQQIMSPTMHMERGPSRPPPSIKLNGEAPPPTPPPRNPSGHAPPSLLGMRQIKEPESPVPGTPPARPPPRMKKPT